MEEQGNIERIDQESIAAKMAENSSYGKGIAIGVEGILPFDEYVKEKGVQTPEKEEQVEEKETIGYFAVPITLPDGTKLDVIVNNSGEDIASIYTDKEGNVTNIELPPAIKNQIARSINGMETKMAPSAVLAALTPDTLEELQRDLVEENLVPESTEKAIEKIKQKYPDAAISYEKETDESEEDLEEEMEEKEEAKKELPTQIRDEIGRICSEHGLDIRDLKEVMVVRPTTLTSSLPDTGINNNGDYVYCLKFRDKSAGTKDRIVMFQPGSKPIDERRYDDYVGEYMTEHRGQVPERDNGDPHSSIYYTDIDGNTTVQKIEKKPIDLTCTEKEQLHAELEKLNNSTNQIINSNLSPEAKAEELTKINSKRLDLFKEYGIDVGTVSSEIQADMEITEDIAEDAQEEKDEPKKEEPEETEEESVSSKWMKAHNEHELPEFPEGPWSSRNKYF